MKLKTVTRITIVGLSITLILNLVLFRWQSFSDAPLIMAKYLLSLLGLYGSLLFFFIHLYRRS